MLVEYAPSVVVIRVQLGRNIAFCSASDAANTRSRQQGPRFGYKPRSRSYQILGVSCLIKYPKKKALKESKNTLKAISYKSDLANPYNPKICTDCPTFL